MLTITLTWATLLWALGVTGLSALIGSMAAIFEVAVGFWHNRKFHRSDWAFACSLVRWPFRPLAWLVIKFLSLPTPDALWGRLWTR